MEHRKNQVKASKVYRWTCPHCRGGSMTLPAAARHLRRRHNECWSCRLEGIMVDSMILGHGWVEQTSTLDVFGTPYPWREIVPLDPP